MKKLSLILIVLCMAIIAFSGTAFAQWNKIGTFTNAGRWGKGTVYQHESHKEIFKVVGKSDGHNWLGPMFFKWYGSHFMLQQPFMRINGVQHPYMVCENEGRTNSKWPDFDHWTCYATDSRFTNINIDTGGFYTKPNEDELNSKLFALFEGGEIAGEAPSAFFDNKEEQETEAQEEPQKSYSRKKKKSGDDRVQIQRHSGGCHLTVINNTPDEMLIMTNGFERGTIPKWSSMMVKGLNCDGVDVEAYAQGINVRKTFHKMLTFYERKGTGWTLRLKYGN